MNHKSSKNPAEKDQTILEHLQEENKYYSDIVNGIELKFYFMDLELHRRLKKEEQEGLKESITAIEEVVKKMVTLVNDAIKERAPELELKESEYLHLSKGPVIVEEFRKLELAFSEPRSLDALQ